MTEEFCRPGDQLPDIVLPDLVGEPHPLSAYQGAKLLLFLWASW
jgi:peroxiredoxin